MFKPRPLRRAGWSTGHAVPRHRRDANVRCGGDRVKGRRSPLLDSVVPGSALPPGSRDVPRRSSMTDDRERWALILGASSGMGEATALTLAANGYRIAGIHLDFRAATAHVEELKAKIEALGSEALYINMNAADDEKRAGALATLRERFDRSAAEGRYAVRPGRHALARVRLARPVPHRGPQGGRRPQEDGDDPGRDGQQPRLLGPGPVAGRVPRAGLEDLRDDVRGVDPGRAVVRRRVVGEVGARVAHRGSSRWSSPGWARASRRTRSARA